MPKVFLDKFVTCIIKNKENHIKGLKFISSFVFGPMFIILSIKVPNL